MKVFPAQVEEYAKRHNPIWPELAEVLREHGVSNYSIYVDEHSSELFAYCEVESEDRWAAIAETEVCQRWWKHMRDVMYTNEDASPVGTELREVFFLQ